MRQGRSDARETRAAPYGAGTRVGVHRSRYELERILGRYGASDFAFVEADARASIQFAMHGRYVQLALPLPDPSGALFTHTPSGRPRAIVAQERAYEQALREHWRALVLAVRGKLQSVESGISTFEEEFKGFLVPQFHEEKGKRRTPKAVNWLLGSSHTLAIGLVAAFFVPASAVGAFALPPNVVDHLSAPFQSSASGDRIASSDASPAVTAGSSSWTRGKTDLAGSTYVSALGNSTSGNEVVPDHGSSHPGSSPATAVTAPAVAANDVPTSAPPTEPSGGGQANTPASSGSASGAGAPTPPPSNGGSSSSNSSAGNNSSSSAGSAGGDSQSGSVTTHPPDDGVVDNSPAPADVAQGSGGQSTKPGDVGSQPPANGSASGGGGSTGGGDGGKTPPPTDPGTPTSTTPTPHDNGNHNGADNGNKADNGSAGGNGKDKAPKDKPAKGKP